MTKQNQNKLLLFLSFGLSLCLGLAFLYFAVPISQAADVNVNATVPTGAGVCGNAVVDITEACDDGNTVTESCGDGTVQNGAFCDATCANNLNLVEQCETDADCDEGVTCNSCVCGSLCFVAGTQISLDNETSLPIEEIKRGDQVLSYNEISGQLEPAEVLKTFEHIATQYLIINNELRVTANHPLYVDGNWLEAGSIEIGDVILGLDDQIVVNSIETEV